MGSRLPMGRKPLDEMSDDEKDDHIQSLEWRLAELDSEHPLDGEVTTQQNRILSVLLMNQGHLVKYDQLVTAACFDRHEDEEWSSHSSIKVQICNLRKAARGRYNIRTVWGHGYVLDVRQETQ